MLNLQTSKANPNPPNWRQILLCFIALGLICSVPDFMTIGDLPKAVGLTLAMIVLSLWLWRSGKSPLSGISLGWLLFVLFISSLFISTFLFGHWYFADYFIARWIMGAGIFFMASALSSNTLCRSFSRAIVLLSLSFFALSLVGKFTSLDLGIYNEAGALTLWFSIRNTAATWLALTMPFAVFEAFSRNHLTLRIAGWVTFTGIFWMVLETTSRAAIVLSFLLFLLTAGTLLWQQGKINWRKRWGIIVASATVLALSLAFMPERVINRFELLIRSGEPARDYLGSLAIDLATDSPRSILLGHGIGKFAPASFSAPLKEYRFSGRRRADHYSHNHLLDYWVEGGLAALILYLALIVLTFHLTLVWLKSNRPHNQEDRQLTFILLVNIMAIVAVGLVTVAVRTSPGLGLQCLMLGLLWGRIKDQRLELWIARKRLLRWALSLLLIPVVGSYILIYRTAIGDYILRRTLDLRGTPGVSAKQLQEGLEQSIRWRQENIVLWDYYLRWSIANNQSPDFVSHKFYMVDQQLPNFKAAPLIYANFLVEQNQHQRALEVLNPLMKAQSYYLEPFFAAAIINILQDNRAGLIEVLTELLDNLTSFANIHTENNFDFSLQDIDGEPTITITSATRPRIRLPQGQVINLFFRTRPSTTHGLWKELQDNSQSLVRDTFGCSRTDSLVLFRVEEPLDGISDEDTD
jgi:hypothetical protein